HVVRPDLDAFALGERARLGARTDVEADDERIGRGGEIDVVLRDPADALVDDADADLWVLDLRELADGGLQRALDVALQDEPQLLDCPLLHLREERLERRATRSLGELLAAQPLGSRLREVSRLALVLDHARDLAGGRRTVEADDLDRVAGLRVLELLAAVVLKGAHLAPGVARDDR